MTKLDEAAIERLRENSHIRLDREGRFWHEGGLVEHPRVAEAFHRGLGRAPDGRATLRVGPTWCYIEVEDTLYQARRALCESTPAEELSSCLLRLDDGTEELLPLISGQVAVGPDGVLSARVKDGREWARLIPEAHAALGRFVQTDGSPWRLRTVSGLLALTRRG
jgi:hypothetical protein